MTSMLTHLPNNIQYIIWKLIDDKTNTDNVNTCTKYMEYIKFNKRINHIFSKNEYIIQRPYINQSMRWGLTYLIEEEDELRICVIYNR